jgi:hypothetical protein
MIGIASRTTGWANPGRRRRRMTSASVAPRAARTPPGTQSSGAEPDSGAWCSRIVAPDIGWTARSAGRGSAGASDTRRWSAAATVCPPPTSAADADRRPLCAWTAFGAVETRRAGSRATCARADRVRPAAPATWIEGEPTASTSAARAAVGTLWIGTVRKRVTEPPTEARGGRPETVKPEGGSACVRACTGTSARAGSGAGGMSAVGEGFTGTGSACAATSGAFAASGAGDGVTGGGAGAAAAGAAVECGFGAAAGVDGVGEGA